SHEYRDYTQILKSKNYSKNKQTVKSLLDKNIELTMGSRIPNSTVCRIPKFHQYYTHSFLIHLLANIHRREFQKVLNRKLAQE
ncbi:CLUMA_CG021407, isoform A, partial [Clunio marinus]